MSLRVDVYFRETDGKMRLLETSPGDDLAGPESFRQSVFGSDVARSLGLRLLPTLATEDIYAEGDSVSQLIAETSIAVANVTQLAQVSDSPEELLLSRFQNILNAARKAVSLGACVVVW